MAQNRLVKLIRSACHGLVLAGGMGLLLSAVSPAIGWDWEKGNDLVPVDIAQSMLDDPAPVLATNGKPLPVVEVSDNGVYGDGRTGNTVAIQEIIDGLGPAGGVLRFPAGRYVTGTIRLRDNVFLRLDRDAVLLGSINPANYHLINPRVAHHYLTNGMGLIVADRVRHVGIVGQGTIDGQGMTLVGRWKDGAKPFLCRWNGCEDVLVSGITMTDPASWVQHFQRCRGVRLDRVTVLCDDTSNGNTDGIDIDCCRDVRVTRCDIRSGDDAICLKTTGPGPCRDVEIKDCRLTTRCNGVKFGTESVGPFEHIRVLRCAMNNVGMAGIAIYSVDGADVRDVVITDVRMHTVRTPIMIRLGSRLATFHPSDRKRTTGSIADVTIRGVRATGAEETGVLISGVPGHTIGPVMLDDVRIATLGGVEADQAPMAVRELPTDYPQDDMFGHRLPASGMYLRHVRGLTLGANVTTATEEADVRPAKVLVDVQ